MPKKLKPAAELKGPRRAFAVDSGIWRVMACDHAVDISGVGKIVLRRAVKQDGRLVSVRRP
jgi:hypothetical protein